MARPNAANGYTTTLNGAINSSVTSLSVNDAVPTELTVPFRVRAVAEGANTNEIMLVTAMSGTGNKDWTVVRAYEPWNGSSSASSHANAATIEHNFTAGTLTDAWVAPTGFIGARAYKNATQNPGGVYTALTFQLDEWDTDGFHDTGSNTSRMTIPSGLAGKYLLSATAYGSTISTGFIYFQKNGTTALGGYSNLASSAGALSIVVDLIAGDYVEVMSSANNSHAASSDNSFTIVKLDAGRIGAAVGCRVIATASQTITTATYTDITFDSEQWDTDGFHSTSSNTDRVTIPTGLGGKYLINGFAFFSSGSYLKIVKIYKNGTTDVSILDEANDNDYATTLSGTLDLVAGDYITLRVYHTKGSNATVGGSADDVKSILSITRIDAMPSPTLTNGEALCTADQALSVGSLTDIPGLSVSLGPGKWLVKYKMLVVPNGLRSIYGKLWDGTNIFDEFEDSMDNNGYRYHVGGFGIFTLTATATVKVSASCDSTTVTVKRDGGASTNHHPTKMSYVKIG